ncbi:VanZ family protein [Listeria booriae]|uniref:VanZ family protein n=1 Tax=Listeria booriae TaxID=1552123 RepID=UPI0016298056|nr:VanZ family protein [Listeria booriae]MBC2035033.1 VanZ family protein [Listeria booriae]MBC2148846.1 VanZ family protein [Listeria booriae]
MKKLTIWTVLPVLSLCTAVMMYYFWFQGWLQFYLADVMATVNHMGYITVGVTALLLYFTAVQLVNWKLNKGLLVLTYAIYFAIMLVLLFGKASGAQGFSSDTFGFIDTFMAGNLRVITIGNVLAFAPIGFLLFRKSPLTALFLAGMMIFAVESLQFVMHVGYFDTGDVFLNVSGIMVGYAIMRIFTVKQTTTEQK